MSDSDAAAERRHRRLTNQIIRMTALTILAVLFIMCLSLTALTNSSQVK